MGRKLVNEVEMMINLRHPCVLPIVGYSLPTRKSPAQIGTRFAEKGSLGAALAQQPRPSFLHDTGVAIIVCGLVTGIAFLHSKDVIHRDLKPENILLDKNAWPMIGDFGTSRLLDMNVTQTNQIGTPLYMAPEMYGDAGYTTAIDIFSLGLIIYEVLVGAPAFSPTLTPLALMGKVTKGERPGIPDSVDPTVREIIENCWATEPGRRPPAAKVLEALEHIQFKLTPRVDPKQVAAYFSRISQ
jgi:serine/threonine protein kinase